MKNLLTTPSRQSFSNIARSKAGRQEKNEEQRNGKRGNNLYMAQKFL
jgi:hypothetical protein